MRLHHHAIITIVATLILMTMGSLVHGTGSSLACPDWPLCHGTFFPAMIHGVEFEHTHRLIAAGVVMLTATLLVRTWRRRAAARGLLLAASLLVVVQAVLGGLTVVYRLRPAISIAHLATSMAFLSVLVVAAVRLAPRTSEGAQRGRGALGLAVAIVYLQIVVGAVVRHTGAALACVGGPLCNGDLWPAAALSRLHMAHRALGALALLLICVASVRASRRAATPNRRAIARLPVVAAFVQVSLGAGVVLGYAPLDLVTLHHVGGALLLGSLVLAWAVAGPAHAAVVGREASPPATRDAAPVVPSIQV
jgi:heme A synthase